MKTRAGPLLALSVNRIANLDGADRPRSARARLACSLVAACALGLAALADEGAEDDGRAHDAAELYFQTDVRPVLELRCFRCHGPDAKRLRGDFSLASRDAVLAGGVSGPGAVPGDPDASLLVQAVRYTDLDLAMPPAEKLRDEEIAVLERWVRDGLAWPADESDEAPSATVPIALDVPDVAPEFSTDELAFLRDRDSSRCSRPTASSVTAATSSTPRASCVSPAGAHS